MYRVTCTRGDCCMPSETGEYVDADEALAVIAELRARVEKLERELAAAMRVRSFYCDSCDRDHAVTPCCGEEECVDTFACAGCGVTCCECCGVGGMCASCDCAMLIDDEEDQDDG